MLIPTIILGIALDRRFNRIDIPINLLEHTLKSLEFLLILIKLVLNILFFVDFLVGKQNLKIPLNVGTIP
jgi:hypothetical protein